MTATARTDSWLGYAAEEIQERCSIPRLELLECVGSTMDVAHDLAAAGAIDGTVVLAETQHSGRGRHGAVWVSRPGDGIWLSLVLRPVEAAALDVLSLRLALRLAASLDSLVESRISVKWPNDLFVRGRKLAGILLEARWRGENIDWVTVGVGLNLRRPRGFEDAAGVRPQVTPLEALDATIQAIRQPATASELSAGELAEWSSRDLTIGRSASSPARGTVAGVTPKGEIVIDTPAGKKVFRAGSLVLGESG